MDRPMDRPTDTSSAVLGTDQLLGSSPIAPSPARAQGGYILNQGGFGTCVGYAFSRFIVDSVLGKYAVPLEVNDVLSVVQAVCPCWEGSQVDRMCDEWTAKVSPTMFFTDTDKKRRYRVGVTYRRISTVEEAYTEAQRLGGVLILPAVIRTNNASGHSRHAVAIDQAYVAPREMRALNSWGATQCFMDVTPANFEYAVAAEPTILCGMVGDGRGGSLSLPVPTVTRAYNEMGLRNQARVCVGVCVHVCACVCVFECVFVIVARRWRWWSLSWMVMMVVVVAVAVVVVAAAAAVVAAVVFAVFNCNDDVQVAKRSDGRLHAIPWCCCFMTTTSVHSWGCLCVHSVTLRGELRGRGVMLRVRGSC
jgi:hypothetical protein